MSGSTQGDGADPSGVKPDAVGRGWIDRGGAPPEPALFFLSGTSLGIGNLVEGSSPVWIELRETTSLDALGDPDRGLQAVEMALTDGRVVRAGWPLTFCDHVVSALQTTLPAIGAPAHAVAPPVAPSAAPLAPPAVAPVPVAAPPAPVGAAPTPAAAVATPGEGAGSPTPSIAPIAAAEAAPTPPAPGGPPADTSISAEAAPAAAAAALVLEDVTYLGGYPGQSKKRKKCTATLTRDAIEVAGPNGLTFRVPWEVIRTIEAQNADEARFRMNTKVHRDATALVMECDQGVTVLLEARDCPTIPLRGAIAQLVGDMPVVVV
ncbi:MAG TPA: hypothetical protein PKE05_00490 [Microthrixaceae bacterium]|nr:hypothetical protein [Microthrixaceae bacterium]